MKITKNVEAEVPPKFFLFDLVTEAVTCSNCSNFRTRQRLNEESPEDLEKLFRNFMNDHFDCILRNSSKIALSPAEKLFGEEIPSLRKTW